MDGKNIQTYKDFLKILNSKKVGEEIKFQIKRGKEKLIKTITLGSKQRDPIIHKLSTYGESQSCLVANNKTLSKKEQKEIEDNIYLSNRGFDCKNAHKRLAKLKRFEFTSGTIVRGSHRVLLSHIEKHGVGAKTICIPSNKYKNTLWYHKDMKHLYDTLFADFITDRELNP